MSRPPAVDRQLAHRVHEAAHLTGDFLLRSGTRSTEYFDKYLFEADPALLGEVATAMAPLVPDSVAALAGLTLENLAAAGLAMRALVTMSQLRATSSG